MSILGGLREISVHRMPCHFPSLLISGLSLSSDKHQMIGEQKTIRFSHLLFRKTYIREASGSEMPSDGQ